MELIITPPQQIADELMAMDSFLNIICSEDAAEATERGNDLAVHIARSGKLLADAKYWLNEKKKSEIFDMLTKVGKAAGATSTVINELTKSLCKEEQYLVDWADRNNRTATHQLEWCRTLISKAKAEMQIAGWNRG
jgi:hypothetical protein